MRLGVRGKLVLLSLLIVVVVSFTFAAVENWLSQRWREEDLQTRAVIFAREIAATIADAQELEAGALIDRKIHQIMAARRSVLQLDIVRFLPAGEAVVASSEPSRRLPFTGADELAIRGGLVVSRLLPGGSEGRSWEVMAPIQLDGGVAGAVAARFSLKRFDERDASSRTVALWLTVISVLVMGTLMAMAVHGVVNRPIERFVRAMKAAEAEPVAVDSHDEFGEMARHFNEMIARARERLFAMQRDLSHAERLALSGRIVAEVAHEVGTPLHSVMGHLELLREDLPATVRSGDIDRRLRVIESQVGRLREIIDRLLDGTRRSPQPAAPVEVNALVLETVELVRPAVAAARLVFSVETAARVPGLMGQRSELQQVVLNLLTNALDATPPGGTIHVATRARGGEVEIEVTDTGCGIPAPELKRVFDPFFTTKDPGRGTGLGLFISAQIVNDHGGHIDVTSEEAQGTSFRVVLPVNGRHGGPA
jgi:signal transduction histidine kinase